MKFILHRDPSNKLQKIPLLAMQLSGLVDAQELIVHVDEGCILLSRDGLSAREAMKTITHLNEVAQSLSLQLVQASNDIVGKLGDLPDPLDEFDIDGVEVLVDCGADPDGLRMPLALEGAADG